LKEPKLMKVSFTFIKFFQKWESVGFFNRSLGSCLLCTCFSVVPATCHLHLKV
jgi:hypothetical protein